MNKFNTFSDYLLLSCSEKTIARYEKYVRTLLRKPSVEAHIQSLTPSSAVGYRTAWNHYQGYLAYIGASTDRPSEGRSDCEELSQALALWGGDATLLKTTHKKKNTDPAYAGIDGFVFYGEGENVISIPESLALLLEKNSKGDFLLD
tara:strand:- start:258 stop:698 length:441 start_codon:yes stop_codon:yes gene_type:complete